MRSREVIDGVRHHPFIALNAERFRTTRGEAFERRKTISGLSEAPENNIGHAMVVSDPER